MTLRKSEVGGIWKRKRWIALCEELAVKEETGRRKTVYGRQEGRKDRKNKRMNEFLVPVWSVSTIGKVNVANILCLRWQLIKKFTKFCCLYYISII
jgi:hypothetical protein